MRPVIVAGIWTCAVLAVLAAASLSWWWTVPALVLVALAMLGTWDLLQTRHTILHDWLVPGELLEYPPESWRSDWVEASAEEFR